MSSGNGVERLAPLSVVRRLKWWHYLLAAIVGAVLFSASAIAFPQFFLLASYSGLKQFIYEDLGLPSQAWATVLALIGSFLYAATWGPFLVRATKFVFSRFSFRRAIAAFIPFVLVYGSLPLLSAIYGTDVCFNQRTGQPIKWYVVQPGGQIILRDSPGVETTGEQRRLVTVQVCRAQLAQKRGIRPHQITDDPRYVRFFDEVTSQPRVWYYKAADGRIDLFDAEGTHPTLGEILVPITKDVVEEAQARAAAKQTEAERAAELKAAHEKERVAQAERAARIAAERAETEARQRAHQELVDLFGVASYSDGVVIVGVSPAQKNDASNEAAKEFLKVIIGAARQRGLAVDQFRPKVYSTGQFDILANGNSAVLANVGLDKKMRAALLAIVSASCNRNSEISGLMGCTISASIRVVAPNGKTFVREWSEIGAGITTSQSIARAVELLAERHPEMLDAE